MLKNLLGMVSGAFSGSTLWFYVAAFSVGLASGGFATHKADSVYYGGQIQEGKVALANEKTAHVADMKGVSDEAARSAGNALLAQQNMQHRQSALEAQHLKEMNDAQAQNDSLRHDVATGRSRLRIAIAAATAAAGGCNAMPAAPGTGSVVNGTSAELDPTAQQSYFDLRDALTKVQSQIGGLQDYVKNVCLNQH